HRNGAGLALAGLETEGGCHEDEFGGALRAARFGSAGRLIVAFTVPASWDRRGAGRLQFGFAGGDGQRSLAAGTLLSKPRGDGVVGGRGAAFSVLRAGQVAAGAGSRCARQLAAAGTVSCQRPARRPPVGLRTAARPDGG